MVTRKAKKNKLSMAKAIELTVSQIKSLSDKAFSNEMERLKDSTIAKALDYALVPGARMQDAHYLGHKYQDNLETNLKGVNFVQVNPQLFGLNRSAQSIQNLVKYIAPIDKNLQISIQMIARIQTKIFDEVFSNIEIHSYTNGPLATEFSDKMSSPAGNFQYPNFEINLSRLTKCPEAA